ncbi:hypothetical protein LTR28_001352, partial [Elasticomyces elasticus]
TSRNLHTQMHPAHLPRSRPEQGRVRLSGPLRGQVLRGQRQGVGEDAGGGGDDVAGGWRGGDGRWVWDV